MKRERRGEGRGAKWVRKGEKTRGGKEQGTKKKNINKCICQSGLLATQNTVGVFLQKRQVIKINTKTVKLCVSMLSKRRLFQ